MPFTSATLSPELNPSNAQRAAQGDAQPSKLAAGKILRIASPRPPNDKLLTQGTWTTMLDPLTIRFRAAAGDPPINDLEKQEEVANAIWARIKNLLPKSRWRFTGFVFGVIFDQGHDSIPSVDLVCATEESCKAIRNELSAIVVSNGSQKASIYTQHASRDTIPQYLVPIDVCGAKVKTSELDSFIEALDGTISRMGSLVGPLRTMLTKVNGEGPLENVVRAFVNLSDTAARLNLYQLLDGGKIRLEWKGKDLRIMHLCRHLRCYQDYALVDRNKVALWEGRGASQSSFQAARDGSDSGRDSGNAR